MKIGVLTLPFNNNYGGYLQAYALMKVLKNMGHEVELIYRQQNYEGTSLSYYVKHVIKLVIRYPHGPFIPSPDNILRFKGKNIIQFLDHNICPRTVAIYNSKDFQKLITHRNYDLIVVGSDQLWRPDYVPNVENFFLSFLIGSETRVVSYAASFGNGKPQYNSEQISECGKGILNFSHISLREKTAKSVIRQFGWDTKKEPVIVLDPTLLLPKEHYLSFIPLGNPLSKGQVFSYILDKTKDSELLISRVSSILDKSVFSLIDPDKWLQLDYIMPSIETWLACIKDADFVVTDSFHGAVFSILFNKPFIVLANPKRGTDRFDTLLAHFDLLDRLLFDFQEERIDEILHDNIDWKAVNSLLLSLKLFSIDYLVSAVNNR